ncbi:amino acid adenylation domain-containing protein [Phormidium sp. LEGE 05292]|uniref:non-ribosomal peptide synthetase n=1 Tax=[Phormidium] sp. LEGE 05292 TaxID=767427 RepID=UPI00187FA957|nr:non-ribosomal peptide synthetase [Phormidium sp. LEGE 05292]MBE9224524.1 amino acid adenylation domain-containing protein [Phormidium sp. LEGE 05292]
MDVNKKENIIARKSKLSPTQLALLQKRLRGEVDSDFKLEAIPRRSNRNRLPLSFTQQRLWFLQQLEPENHFYNECGAIQLTGSLDIESLEKSINEIVQRHEALHTVFEVVEGQPFQVITPNLKVSLPVVNLNELSEIEQKIEVQRIAIAHNQHPFDLVRGPLLRWKLLQLNEREYILLFAIHHIVFDGWSVAILVRELSAFYQAFLTRKPLSLPELPIQYADFAIWQREELQGEKLQSQLSYWKQQLKNAPPLLQLPTDRSRPLIQTYRGARQSFTLPKTLTDALKAIGRQTDATLFMTLLAAFKILLYRYTGQQDLVIGSPIANRNRSELEGLIGFFVNNLVVRTDISGNPTFEELLRRIKKVVIEAYTNQDLPFEKLVEELQPERNINYNPLFQVSFALQNTPKVNFELPGLTITPFEIEYTKALFDLHLDINETDSGLEGFWEYNTDLFDAATINRMNGHFQILLEAIANDTQQRVDQLPLLTLTERHQLLIDWNQTQADYPKNTCIHQLFEAQVERTPDAVAVVFEDKQLTYQELNIRANQLAHYLQKLGVKPEILVGICVERSLEMLIGLLGILKAGGAYLPLDPAYPKERLTFMLRDANVPVLLTQQTLLDKLSEYSEEIFCLDTDWQLISQSNQHNPSTTVKPENLAYVIYTSGSTGNPKGVLIEHHSLVNFTQAAIAEYQISASDRIFQFASTSFDAAAEEIYPCLISGGSLILRTEEMLKSISAFINYSKQWQITLWDLPTAYWHFLVNELANSNLRLPESLRLVILGGERVLLEKVATWYQLIGDYPQLVNSYGPTETTVVATLAKLSKNIINCREISIGKPINNVQVYVLDRHFQPVPIGVPGELHIGGIGLARGYLNRPELTTEKFITNPFDNSKLYKTGDLVRYLSDGNLEYLGRIDQQVKIRGFRIELGEIETALIQHPAVRETVVLAQEKVLGNKFLVAYIVTEQPEFSISELRHFLKEKLPEYMVPSVFIQIEALPLTPNGKIDRNALPKPDTTRPELEKVYTPPSTPIEIKLVEIWAQVLGVEKVGIYDNFFELGGDSILTIQIVARASQAGLQLTPKELFKHQNIAELAAVAVTKKEILTEQGIVTGAVFLTPIQKWFFEQNLLECHHFNQTVLLEIPQEVDLNLLEQALRHLLLHHDALRLQFEEKESAQFTSDLSISLTHCDFSKLAEAEQKLAIETTATELQASLNLSSGPLLRVGFFDLGANKSSRLLIVIHHLVVDGVSWRILLEDLQTAYQQLVRGKQVNLPAKTTSFQQWAQKLREYARSTTIKQQLNYWQSLSQKPSISLPVDFPGGENTMATVDCVSVTLSFSETQALLKEVPQIYQTQINDVLLAALVQAFAQWTGEQTLLIDLEGHGREEISDDVDLSRTVGWFTTVFPVFLNLEKASNPGDVLKKVKEQLRSIPHRGIGYGVLRYLSDDRQITEQLSTLPQAEVIFNYLGQFDQTLSELSFFSLAQESSGLARSSKGKRCHLLEIDGLVKQGQLQLNWSYSQKVHRRSTIEFLAQNFVAALRSIVAHCQPFATDLNNQNIEDFYLLSHAQQGMLFHSLLEPKSGVYFAQLSCDLHGLNVIAFVQAWQQVINRHSVLRTAFLWEKLENPIQIVNRQVELDWQTQNWQNIPPHERKERLEKLLEADRKRSFELSKTPLMRFIAIELTETHYHFIWSHHHLLLDGWSIPIIFKEVIAYYQGFCQGQIPDLKPPSPYRNYISWLQQQDMLSAERFWREKLKGFTTPTSLGVGKTALKLPNQEENYNEQEIKLSIAKTTALKTLAQQYYLTLNTLIQGAWALLLSRYSTEEDVVFGTTVSGRPSALPNVESMVGLFINTLPIRVQVSPDEFLIPWLKRIQTENIEVRQYEYSPLVEIHGWSEVPRDLPLFESLVVFENYPIESSLKETITDLKIENVRAYEKTNYPLNLLGIPGSELVLKIAYNSQRFDAATITRMLGHLQTLLEGMVSNPQVRLSDLPLLTPSERHQLLVKWNNTQVDYPQTFCIHQLFETQVERTPDAVAVVFEDQQLTYRELNVRANQLAHYLQKLGVKPEVLVGICVERSLEMAIGLLGILKAGGAYVPLDPEYPSQRLQFMLTDSQVPVFLTQQKLLESLPKSPTKIVCLDTDWQLISQSNQHNSSTNIKPENLAYVIYTSGSTGKPKGAMNTHQGICNRLLWMQQAYQLNTDDVVLQKTPFSFDVSVWEFFWPLLNGSRLAIAKPGGHRDSQYLVNLIVQQQVSTLHFVPSMLQIFLENQNLKSCHSLRRVICSGEALSVELQAKFFAQLQCELHNLYGPTEAAIDVTFWQCQKDSQLTTTVPIGRPIANTQIYILDQNLQPTPIGVPGELHIGGIGLARGYLNRPELTNEKFIDNPFENSKLYKTGDLARYLLDGNIEYLGRIDHQVKIRGFRIELGEIEAALSQHSQVRETVVIAREDASGDKRLIAYIVPNSKINVNTSELRSFLQEKLPDYMLPTAFVMLEALPLTPNGKLDRKALPAPDISRNNVSFVSPRNSTEETIAAIYAEVLGLEKVGIYDNFFDLGGHSLLATRVISRLRSVFQIELPLSSLFEKPTVALLSDRITTMRQLLSQISQPSIVVGNGRKEIEL